MQRKLKVALERWRDEARARWPNVTVAPEAFERHVALHLRADSDVDSIHGADLYLACACAGGNEKAVEALERLAFTPAALRRPNESPAEFDELCSTLRIRLLVSANAASRPKIAQFAGRSSLQHWVRMVAARLSVDAWHARARAGDGAGDLELPVVEGESPDVALLRERCRPAFAGALTEALRSLEPAERTILRERFLERASLDLLAERYGVHRATIVRRLDRARSRVMEATRAKLQRSLQLGPSQIESLEATLLSGLDVSIRRLLAN